METGFRFNLIVRRLLEQEFTLQAIQLRLPPPFSSFVCLRQRVREYRKSCLWLSHGSICLSEERQEIRSSYPCSHGTIGGQALVYLLDPCLRLSLLRQRPAAQESTEHHPVGKSPFLGEADGGFGVLLGDTCLATVLMEYGSKTQDKTQVNGVRDLLRQRHRLIVP